jgi:hypothetical protein
MSWTHGKSPEMYIGYFQGNDERVVDESSPHNTNVIKTIIETT